MTEGALGELHQLDDRLRAALRADARFSHVVAYGSVPQGYADRFSDLKYWAFLRPGAAVDAADWLRGHLAPLLVLTTEFGGAVAVLPGLCRVELHVAPASRPPEVETWTPQHVRPEAMCVRDEDGQLTRHLLALAARSPDPAAEAQATLERTVNWLVLGLNVLARGERLRAHETLWWVEGGLLRLVRLHEGATGHWGNATRCAEQELSPAALARFAALTGPLDELERRYAAAVGWTLDLAAGLGLALDDRLAQELRRGRLGP
ncbi:hypothetical protein [Deinococcus soli (ex Cha et al. 2016)]|uniref:Lincosamide nucleotidyltransferase n=2 Tax=Deinococcus soli (ex Cha et al. 2016) TaxID=1309411 RepID=A0AAE3XDG2_9DEIO|nr:hypothetical protein [Deinococcus soli (ex Cha et al. 2016)]MDR6219915.1 lincosamide nucleotidyltransferase [Deinococcus soli (ex Cha et al. 2016)]MDR6329827.1 lincosamide nucleotidyltransferase [Deinococcus soli (ex Cha et al. 2016)]MDR6752822.1 lincosamide nucleotidyltransferase [Deinococcus soli (ex Cha et al. 2016)]